MEDSRMSFGEHLEELRRVLIRILCATAVFATGVFFFKEKTFALLLAPRNNSFVTFRAIEKLLHACGSDFAFGQYDIRLISTELSAQFMMHLETACILGALLASPFIVYQIFCFIRPALYENERRHSVAIGTVAYALFLVGVLMNYFVLFPIAYRFLATYQVDGSVENAITITSYVSTFATLSLTMGLVFELPVLGFILGRLHLLSASLMQKYRRHALVGIMVVAAFITPPDIFTLLLVTLPLYLLYEATIVIVARVNK